MSINQNLFSEHFCYRIGIIQLVGFMIARLCFQQYELKLGCHRCEEVTCPRATVPTFWLFIFRVSLGSSDWLSTGNPHTSITRLWHPPSLTLQIVYLKYPFWAREMAQKIKVIVAKAENLSSTLKSHTIEGENEPVKIVLCPPHT